MDLHPGEDGENPIGVLPMNDVESILESVCFSVPTNKSVIFQGTHRIQRSDSLFYTTVTAAGVSLKALIDSGSTGCTLSEQAVKCFLQHNPDMRGYSADVETEVYDCKMVVPMVMVPGQTHDMILGSNAIKTMIQRLSAIWQLMSEPSSVTEGDSHHLFPLLSNMERWRGNTVPDKIGTLKLQRCVTLQPQSEHLTWGKSPPPTWSN